MRRRASRSNWSSRGRLARVPLKPVAHIPFGHTIEDEFCILPRHDVDSDRTEHFLGEASTIGRLIIGALGKGMYDRFRSIYTATKTTADQLKEDRFIYDLVSDTACADLLDYLRRDAYFCNVSIESDYRFLKYLCLQRQDSSRRLVIRLWKQDKPTPRPDLLSELIRLLDNRYLLSERVYFHHARLISGAMMMETPVSLASSRVVVAARPEKPWTCMVRRGSKMRRDSTLML